MTDQQYSVDQLFEWQSPRNFNNLTHELMTPIPNNEIFRNPRYQILLEAHVTASFLGHVEADQIRMCKDVWPDFELTTNIGTTKSGQTSLHILI